MRDCRMERKKQTLRLLKQFHNSSFCERLVFCMDSRIVSQNGMETAINF